jgi:putative hydrolase of the HAD superfamily
MNRALRAVLFDWGHTLMDFVWDDELTEAGHRAGVAALGREELPDFEAMAADFRARFIPLLEAPDTLDEVEYPGLVRRVLADFGIEVTEDELARFLDAEHEAWQPARRLASMTHALLDALRERGLALGVVSNAFDPGWLLHRDLERMQVAHRLDVAVFSSEVGKCKPHPAIFERALDAVGAAPEETLFVGDRLYEDVRGAGELGMTTVQALWFRADDHPDGREPDYEAFTMFDVLNIVERLRQQAAGPLPARG